MLPSPYHTQDQATNKAPIKISFLSLLSGGTLLFIPATWPLILWYHKLVLTLILPLPYIFIYLCNKCVDAPHIITRESYGQNISRYPYDYKLFHPNTFCTVCQFPKPARSRHCSRCRVCVARADHHCIWVNNCIGFGNYKYFLALLLSMTIVLAYAAWLAYITLASQVRDHFQRYPAMHAGPSILRVMFNSLRGTSTGGWEDRVLVWIGGWFDTIATALLVGGIAQSGVGLLALLTAPLPAGLLVYHAYLIWEGMTTYESATWNAWRDDIAAGEAYIATIVGNDESNSSAQQNAWPKRSRQFLVRTSDGLPPRNVQPEIEAVVGDHAQWRRCTSLKVDNTYNLGVWRNWRDVLLN